MRAPHLMPSLCQIYKGHTLSISRYLFAIHVTVC